ncbi:nucleotidyl transferase AbiEii/AbiGii toxin family protein [Desulfobacterium sp. N47]|uniref:nucleotidyl transferase AbiEii/AbiGii toxin family protein n=1 Tax=Desulfobacterium sp. N47 TaxID=3115210 RepID=UPI003C91254C
MPQLSPLKNEFYLAGGTALALQIGHRDSIDFDFFKTGDFDTQQQFQKIKRDLNAYKLTKIQEEINTLTVLVDNEIILSFIGYNYPLIRETINEKYLCMAAIEDIAAMKMSAILSRASNKDYIDLYFILQTHKLNDLLELAQKKFPDIDINLILKSLVYFADISTEPINFKNDKTVDFEDVKSFLIKTVKNLNT